MSSIFTKIMRGDIKGTILYEDEHCAAIQDVQPEAPQHILIVPRKEIASAEAATQEDKQILGHLLLVAAEVARRHGFAETGYRLVINTGKHAGMTVDHLHVHLMGGRKFSWPPG